MIHFDFIVDDTDAQNIMSAIEDKTSQMRMMAIEHLNEDIRKWCKNSIDYFNQLKEKMLNYRVEQIEREHKLYWYVHSTARCTGYRSIQGGFTNFMDAAIWLQNNRSNSDEWKRVYIMSREAK